MVKNSIGGAVFVRNALKYDYCIIESIYSLTQFCDEVIVIDCQSDDGTTTYLESICGNLSPKIKLVTGQEWELGEKHERLAIIANIARKMLSTKWHFMLQADEVVHESSIPYIINAVNSGISKSYRVRRYNLLGNLNYYVAFDSEKKLVGDNIVRLATVDKKVIGDAETIEHEKSSETFLNDIKIIHYGFVRNGAKLLEKSIDTQTWFLGSPDQNLVKQKEKDGIFDPSVYFELKHLKHLGFKHPEVCKRWVARHMTDPTYKSMI